MMSDREQLEDLRKSYNAACELIVDIHKAASGKQPTKPTGIVQEVLDLRQQRDQLLHLVSEMQGCIQWMSGSADFGPEGQAYEGWIKNRHLTSDPEWFTDEMEEVTREQPTE